MSSVAQTIARIILAITILTIAIVTGYLITSSIRRNGHPSFPPNATVYDYLFSSVDRHNIRKHLFKFTEELGWKVAGTQAEHDAAFYIRDYFQSVGLTGVKLVPYQVLLSYPDPEHPNTLEVLKKNGSVLFEANRFEDMSLSFVNNETAYPYYLRSIFIAYSGSGVVQGPILYVRYARNEDFEALKDRISPSVICLARYGKISRMIKAENAQTYGCGGMLLYSNPEEFNSDGNTVFYPNSEFLPPGGVQRGTLKDQKLGDFLTPAYPANHEAYRLDIKEAGLPTIPFQVIREDDAFAIFELMNCSSRSVCDSEDSDIEGRLSITMHNIINETNNVIGFIAGKEEPDRYVIIGNHYDSWGPGAIDPNIGSSIVMELSRILMAFQNETGWQPRRSIIFCEWGAEEYGSLGSREFVEQFSKVLSSRTVAYINTDVAVLGNYSIKFKSQPLLRNLIFNSTKSIPEPYQSEDGPQKSLYDTYLEKFPDKKKDSKRPKIYPANTGSDYVHFIGLAGVPCLDIRYTYDESLGLNFYPLYHSAYENFHAFESFIDPEFKYSEVVTKVMGDLALKLSSEAILPYSVDEYVENVIECVSAVDARLKATDGLLSHNKMAALGFETKLEKLSNAGIKFMEEMKQVDAANDLEVRILNDRMMLLEKAFLYEHSLEGRESVRNALHAPSDGGGQVCLAEINTMLDSYNHPKTQQAYAKREILKEVARIHYFLDTAISILNPQVLP